ncbi:hypothetical protein ACFV0D_37670 [Streptomyces sp. NPDC059556]
MGTGLVCALAATYLGLTGQTTVAAIIGGIAVAAFTAFSGMTVTIHIRR